MQVVLQSGLDGVSQSQWAVAALVVLLGLAAATAALYWGRYAGLPAENRTTKATLLRERYATTPEVFRISGDIARDELEAKVRDAYATARGETPDGPGALKRGVAEGRRVVSDAWGPVADRVPSWSLRIAEYAILLAVLGAIAVDGKRIGRALYDDGGVPGFNAMAARALELTGTVIETGIDVVLSFPYIGNLWALVFTTLTVAGRWGYEHWYVTAGLLLLGAVAVAVVELRLDEDLDAVANTSIVTSHWAAAGTVAKFAFSIWLLGVVPAGLGSRAGLEQAGSIVGFALAMVAFLAGAVYAVNIIRLRLWGIVLTNTGSDLSRIVAAWLLVRYAWAVIALATVPILVGYAIAIVATDNGRAVLAGLAGANPGVQALLVLVVLAVVVTVLYRVRVSWGDVSSYLSDVATRQRYRAGSIRRGVPFVAWVLGYVVTFGFSRSIGVSLLGASVIALGSRGVYVGLIRLRHRFASGGETAAKTVQCAVYPPLSDGEREVAMADVGDERLLADDIDELADAVGSSVTADGLDPVPAMSRGHTALSLGIVDDDRAQEKTTEKVRKAMFGELRPVGNRVTEDRIDQLVGDEPPDAVERVWERHDDCLRTADGYVWLDYDPYQQSTRRQARSRTAPGR